jgi:hypothetical protein
MAKKTPPEKALAKEFQWLLFLKRSWNKGTEIAPTDTANIMMLSPPFR